MSAFLTVDSGSATRKNSTKPSFKQKIRTKEHLDWNGWGTWANVNWTCRPICTMKVVMQPQHRPHTSCHSAISHNLPMHCFWSTSPAGLSTGMWRSHEPPAPHGHSCRSPSGTGTPRPQRQPGWQYGPSLLLHLKTDLWIQCWQNSHCPVCQPMTVFLSYL